MKPGRLQYLLTHSIAISAICGASATVIPASCQLLPLVMPPTNLVLILWFALGVVVVLPLGAFLGLVFLTPFVFAFAGRLNGAPFEVGESVCILTAQHRGRIVRIYKVWRERSQVRVELGGRERIDVTDVFGHNQVCRVRGQRD